MHQGAYGLSEAIVVQHGAIASAQAQSDTCEVGISSVRELPEVAIAVYGCDNCNRELRLLPKRPIYIEAKKRFTAMRS